MKKENETECSGMSRRQMLAMTGALAASATMVHFSGILQPAQAKDGSTEQWPWPYEKLDPGKTAEIAYEEWYCVLRRSGH
jgi:hypothetical protein